MLTYAYIVCDYVRSAVVELDEGGEDLPDMIRARNLAEIIARALFSLRKVIDQAEPRVLKKRK